MSRTSAVAVSPSASYTGHRFSAVASGGARRRLLGLVVATVILGMVAVALVGGSGVAGRASHATSGVRVPVAAWGPISRVLGRDDPAYRATAVGAGFVVRNARQHVSAQLSSAGVRVRSGALVLGMRLRAYGRGAVLAPLPTVAPSARANTVSYRYGPLTESYTNGPLGVEQRFTLTSRPAASQGGPLTLALHLSGNAHASLTQTGQALTLRRRRTSLSYQGLTVTDARGRALPAWLVLHGPVLLLRVYDAGAVYPLTIDPFVQQAELTASDLGGLLGVSAAISGKTIVVGAPGAVVNGHPAQGAVYVFVEPGGSWANATQTARLTASDGAPGDELGGGGPGGFATGTNLSQPDVGVSGNVVVAGAPVAAINGNAAAGAVYVWLKPKGGWHSETQQAKLTASHGAPNEFLGNTATVSGKTVVAGAVGATVGGNVNEGAVYVFTMPTGGWRDETEQAKLTASDGVAGTYFGGSLAMQNTTVVAGAPTDFLRSPGAVYVFVEPKGGWTDETQTAELTASNGTLYATFGAQLGWSVAIDGATIVGGAPCQAVNGNSCQGAAYVFLKPTGGWMNETETAELTDGAGAVNDNLGLSVAVLRGTVLAGAPFAAGFSGYADVFVAPAGGWQSENATARLTPSDFTSGFGWSTAMSPRTLLVGAWGGGTGFGGAAYVFSSAGAQASAARAVRARTARTHALTAVACARFAQLARARSPKLPICSEKKEVPR